MPAHLVLNTKQYSAYVTVLAGEGDGPLIYIDSKGHIHGPIPEGPEATRLSEAAAKHVKTIEGALNALATEVAR
jgi:hypothetical protein